MAKTDHKKPLKYGWTTGACATAATKAALDQLLTRNTASTVTITLPQGQTPIFKIEKSQGGNISPDQQNFVQISIIKDAGDDPDVTHGALISAKVFFNPTQTGIIFRAGEGVGTVTRPGLPLPVGAPAINPMPRKMMTQVVEELCAVHNVEANLTIEISVANGAKIAQSTLNRRLGIIGGISILGTTGIVVPYSCSAWIHSIHRGIDVAKATGAAQIVACVGSTSERMMTQLYPDIEEQHYIDMGDFVGGTLKYLRKVPIAKVIVAGGFGKFSKLAQGHRDLHSKRSTIDIGWLAEQLQILNASPSLVQKAKNANTALEVFTLASQENLPLGNHIAQRAQQQCQKIVRMNDVITIEIKICDRNSKLIGAFPE